MSANSVASTATYRSSYLCTLQEPAAVQPRKNTVVKQTRGGRGEEQGQRKRDIFPEQHTRHEKIEGYIKSLHSARVYRRDATKKTCVVVSSSTGTKQFPPPASKMHTLYSRQCCGRSAQNHSRQTLSRGSCATFPTSTGIGGHFQHMNQAEITEVGERGEILKIIARRSC